MNCCPADLLRWVEVDLDAVAHNLKETAKLLSPGVKIMAVVKADAYGHGAPRVARTLLANGADMLAVTFVEEGIRLRKEGINAPILVFAPVLPEQAAAVAAHNLTASVSTREAAVALAQEAARRGTRIPVHLKVETGMGRTGLFPEEVPALAREIVSQPALELEGVYTHFASAANGDRQYTEQQFARLLRVLAELESAGIQVPLPHACNSAATLMFPRMHLKMVRLGTVLYGQYPGGAAAGNINLRDTWTLKTRVIHAKKYPAGTSVGYGRTYRTRRETWIAVLPLGFVDGFTLEPHAKPTGLLDLLKIVAKITAGYLGFRLGPVEVRINGRRVPVVGKVAMQLTMVDLGEQGSEADVGAVAVVPARRTSINPLIPKLYLEAGRPVALRTAVGEEIEFGREAERGETAAAPGNGEKSSQDEAEAATASGERSGRDEAEGKPGGEMAGRTALETSPG